MARERISITRPLAQFHFALDPLVDGQTDAAVTPIGTVAPLMPWGGSVVGISVVADEAAGAGVTTYDVKIDSTQQEINASMGASAVEVYDTFTAGTYRFTAGQQLALTYTSGTLTTNAGVHGIIFVEFDGVGTA